MASKIPAVTIKSMQALLTQIGSATSGRKDNLISRLARDLKVPRLPTCTGPGKSIRILSIDMGIKNLAFCIADVKAQTSTLETKGEDKEDAGTKMNIVSWRRLDVVEEVSRSMITRKLEAESIVNEEEVEDPYTPSALSSTAYTLLTQTLLSYKPDIVLIERQRWRSSGGVAIQQWTVRVNTLEGMLWAILTALRAESKVTDALSREQNRDYDIFGVDPKRVGRFWIGENERRETLERAKLGVEDELIMGSEGEVEDIIARKDRPIPKKLSRGNAEKKAKIQLLRSWLTPKVPSTVAQSLKSKDVLDGMSPAINFTFSPEAEATRTALCSTKKVKGERKSARLDTVELKKLDDVTDCFLQAAAWVAWEVNRKKMVQDWDSEQRRRRSLDGEDSEKRDEVTARGRREKATNSGATKAETAKLKEVPKPQKKLSGTKSKREKAKVEDT
jgi:cruciform cutting endonuclease 1